MSTFTEDDFYDFASECIARCRPYKSRLISDEVFEEHVMGAIETNPNIPSPSEWVTDEDFFNRTAGGDDFDELIDEVDGEVYDIAAAEWDGDIGWLPCWTCRGDLLIANDVLNGKTCDEIDFNDPENKLYEQVIELFHSMSDHFREGYSTLINNNPDFRGSKLEQEINQLIKETN